MTQLTKVKQNTHGHKDKSCNPKNTKTNSWPNRARGNVTKACSDIYRTACTKPEGSGYISKSTKPTVYTKSTG